MKVEPDCGKWCDGYARLGRAPLETPTILPRGPVHWGTGLREVTVLRRRGMTALRWASVLCCFAGSTGASAEEGANNDQQRSLGISAEAASSASGDQAASNGPPASASEPRVRGGGASVRLHTTLGAIKAITGHQSREYGFGMAGFVALEWGPSSVWGVQVEASYQGLLGVDRAPPVGLSELGGATGGHLGAGLRVRPFAQSGWTNPKGFWLSGAVGAELTGGVVAPLLDVFAGYDIYLRDSFAIGPTVGYVLVLQTKESPRPDNANLMLAGIHGTFDFGSRVVTVEKDRDHDRILDADDQCPDVPEDYDGFEDGDGCPDLDNDQDSIVDSVDRCPLDPEDGDGFEDEDGCPDVDNDHDGLLDPDDQCPNDPEDRDDFEDEDGCPDPDNDQDKIPDVKDLCPDEPEIVNGIADNDGCPDAESVRIVGDKIELDQKIHFWTNSDRIRAMSYPVLDKLARFLLEHPEYVHVEIEGHADERGEDELNLDLSRRRAQAIRNFLVKRGLAESRLSYDGFGSSRPLVTGDDEHSWFLNRRVEFIVTRNRLVKTDKATGKIIDAQSDEPDMPAFGRDTEVPKEDIQ